MIRQPCKNCALHTDSHVHYQIFWIRKFIQSSIANICTYFLIASDFSTKCRNFFQETAIPLTKLQQ